MSEVRVVDADLVAREGVTEAELELVERRERAVLSSYVARFCGGRERVDRWSRRRGQDGKPPNSQPP